MRYILQSFLALCLLSGLSYSHAASNNFDGKRFKAWAGNCEPGPQGQAVCYLKQVLQQDGHDILRAIVGYAPGKPYPTVFFELPAGVAINAGVSLKVDKKKPISFRGRCTQQLCSAGFVLNSPIMKQFMKGQTAVVSYLPAGGQQPVSLPVSLMGVTAGLKALPR